MEPKTRKGCISLGILSSVFFSQEKYGICVQKDILLDTYPFRSFLTRDIHPFPVFGLDLTVVSFLLKVGRRAGQAEVPQSGPQQPLQHPRQTPPEGRYFGYFWDRI